MAESHPIDLFEKLHAYSFQTDSEFANGLAIILGHAGTPASEAEMTREDDLVMRAKCFFFSRKENITPPIDFTAYKAWLAGKSSESGPTAAKEEPSSTDVPATGTGPVSDPSAPEEPAYPTSFAHIVELITTGQPIPGIQEIPDTVLEGHDISSERPRRRKPWEKEPEETISLQPETTSHPA